MAVGDIKKLTAREHILKYPDAFLGSTATSMVPRTGYKPGDGIRQVAGYAPASVRCFQEVVDNALDAAIRVKFKCGTNIHITFNNDGFIVEDDGHGIPIKYNEKEKMWSPQLAMSEERAGSNFEVEERSTVGMYGVGVFAVNVLSKEIQLITSDGKNVYSQTFSENCTKMTDPQIKKKKVDTGTYVSVKLDTTRIQWRKYDIYCCLQLLNNIMFVYPEVDITAELDGKGVELLKGDKYLESLDINPWFVVNNPSLRAVFGKRGEHHDMSGLVNGTECSGVHISTFKSVLSNELVDILGKEIEGVSRADISKALSGIASFRIVNPTFGGLTKTELTGCDQERLKADISLVLPQVLRGLLDSSEFKAYIKETVDKRSNRQLQSREKKAARSRKSLKLVDVYHKGGKREKTYLLITEGDSAKGLFIQARDPAKHALYPLRGKILNVIREEDTDTVAKNEVLFELATVMGLSFSSDDISRCQYDYIVALTDADYDGDNICGLLYGFFWRFWPQLFHKGRVLRLLTPRYIHVKGNQRTPYYHDRDLPKSVTTSGKLEYIKGLASLTLEDVEAVLKDPMFEVLEEDPMAEATIDIVLGNSADKKRTWLGSDV